MERDRELDFACLAAASEPLKRFLTVFLLLGCFEATGSTQSSLTESPATLEQLAAQDRWQQVAQLAEATHIDSADVSYYYGIALAHLGRMQDACRVLLGGSRKWRSDKRFPIELGGVEFKRRRYPEATKWLRRALALDPSDAYANNFLGSVYFLQGNLEAALKYWNRIGKPEVASIVFEPKPRVNAVLLDRAFAFSHASILQRPDFLATQARLQGLEIFPSYSFNLDARDDGKFNVQFRGQERNGWGNSKWQGLLSFFRGIFQQTVYPEYFNLRGSATNITSLFRWDAQKRRLAASLSGPWKNDAKWRYRIGADLRNENWDIRSSSGSNAIQFAALNLRRESLATSITSFASGRWSWSAAAELSHRDVRNAVPGTTLTPELLSTGYQLKQLADVSYDLWRMPERRLTITSSASSELARIWSEPRHTFWKPRIEVAGHWLPRAVGDDWELHERIRVGATVGEAPFDELFMLGLERDNDLWLRAHPGTHDGRKGSAPLGGSFALSNWELDKNVYERGIFKVKLGPFLDVGKIGDSSPGLATRKWLWDTGVQAKVRALGHGLVFVYGKDLRTGNNAFYATVGW